MSEPNFNPGRYCGDVPLPPPDNKSSVDMFTPLQRDALRKMIQEEISKSMEDPPNIQARKGKKKQNFVGRVEEE